jgi:superfamily II DNA/RNA helicase
LTNFEKLSLSENVLSRLKTLGYTAPTPIQEQVIPWVLQGLDILGCAQTGTGKTASYVLPILDILSQGRSKAMMPRALILIPTRELALQVQENLEDYGHNFKIKSALVIGGVSSASQEQKLSKGVDVLIATPGRFLDLYERGKILLADTKMLVVDEADRMLDMGFIPDIQRIVSLLPRSRQTVLLSATMPKEIRGLAKSMLDMPKEVTVSPPTQTGENIDQKLVSVPKKSKDVDYDKRQVLRDLLKNQGIEAAIIFCNRKTDVDTLQRSLTRHGYKARGLHGDLAQKSRTETMEMFKAGELPFLIASDIAARGLDVDELPNVINYSIPHNGEDYIHRIGRTGRAGNKGHAWMLVAGRDQKNLEQIEKTIKLKLDYAPGFEPGKTRAAETTGDSKADGAASREKKTHGSAKKKQDDMKCSQSSKPVHEARRDKEKPVPDVNRFEADNMPAFLRQDVPKIS